MRRASNKRAMEAGPRGAQPLDDLGEAERALKSGNLTMAAVKGGRLIFSTSVPGLRAIFSALGALGGEFPGSSVADKVVGRAAALLYAHYGARAVFGATMSEGAAAVLRERGIGVRFDRLVPEIRGRDGVGMCPFERAVMGIRDPGEAVREISRLLFDPPASAREG
jgi:hypothetical protein